MIHYIIIVFLTTDGNTTGRLPTAVVRLKVHHTAAPESGECSTAVSY